MRVYVVYQGGEPEGAFENQQLASEFIIEHYRETGVRFSCKALEVIRQADRPQGELDVITRFNQTRAFGGS